MTRDRVITEITSLEQALKVEQTVRTGYCDTIIENLVAWIAVEEDLSSSYEKLAEKHSGVSKSALERLSQESKDNVKMLSKLQSAIEEAGRARIQREDSVRKLAE